MSPLVTSGECIFRLTGQKKPDDTRAHGLGNNTAASLRHCQVQRLYSLVAKVRGVDTAMWIDTLCIPVQSELLRYRKMAIDRMNKVYANASAVIAIDRRLAEHVGNDPFVRILELSLCDWTHRLWTLQETLSPGPEKLFIVFQNETISLKTMIEGVERSTTVRGLQERDKGRRIGRKLTVEPLRMGGLYFESPESMVETNFVETFSPCLPLCRGEARVSNDSELRQHVRSLMKNDVPVLMRDLNDDTARSIRFHRLIEAASMRRTTFQQDEALCLAILLGMDISALGMRFTWRDVLCRLSFVPTLLLFLRGPRIEEVGFRWAPQSILHARNGSTEPLESHGHSRLTAKGLEVILPGFFLAGMETTGQDVVSRLILSVEGYERKLFVAIHGAISEADDLGSDLAILVCMGFNIEAAGSKAVLLKIFGKDEYRHIYHGRFLSTISVFSEIDFIRLIFRDSEVMNRSGSCAWAPERTIFLID